MRSNTILACLLLSTFLVHAILHAQETPTANVGWYNGQCQSGVPSQANWFTSAQQFSRTFDNFVVPDAGWTITGVFSDNRMSVTGVDQASWEIRRGVSPGNGGTVVASGVSAASQLFLATLPDGGEQYRIQVDGIRVRLGPGTYWLNVSPVVPSSYHTQSFVCSTRGANGIGTPAGTDGLAFFYSVVLVGSNFQPVKNSGEVLTSGDFSHGVLLATSNAVPAPSITAVVNAASWQPGAVSPGEIVTIMGTDLGPATASTLMLDQDWKVSTSLNGVQVLLNGVPAPQIYVSRGQINAVVPYEVAAMTNPTLQVIVAGQASKSVSLISVASAPAIFTANASGKGPGAILNQDSTCNAPSKPAAKGTIVTLYVTGEGLTRTSATGEVTTVATAPPYTPPPILPVTAQIGGQSVPVHFYGEAPNMVAGVMQVNVQIPATSASGDLPISVTVGTATTPSGVTISVQ